MIYNKKIFLQNDVNYTQRSAGCKSETGGDKAQQSVPGFLARSHGTNTIQSRERTFGARLAFGVVFGRVNWKVIMVRLKPPT